MDKENLKRQLGYRLKALRMAKGLKQEDLETWGFSYRYYGKMERGLVNPTIETLARLCEIFEIDLVCESACKNDPPIGRIGVQN